jgi:hypothetical protein
MTSAKQSGLLFDVARFSEKDAQFDGNLKSMEALSIGEQHQIIIQIVLLRSFVEIPFHKYLLYFVVPLKEPRLKDTHLVPYQSLLQMFTPNADLDLTARVKITNKDFGFFEIRMIIIFAEIGGNI